jgi:NAD/NADP transhydrogenase alpha subunit
VLKETLADERRVAAVPRVIDLLKKSGVETWIESGAGSESGFTDDDYRAKGAQVADAATVRAEAQILLHVRVPQQPTGGKIAIGFCDPLSGDRGALRASKIHAVFDGVCPAHHARAIDGRALVDGVDCGI